ncbi:MAG: zinc-ribbon domain-containing protein [Clostridia bacterium]|nr:zinc-ribbon domain-containing protein [Clostridia bacterium]
MGLKKVAETVGLSGALSGVVQSAAWKEYFQSGDMSNGVIMKRGEKIIVGGSKNTKADDNLISAGSGIDVQEGQAMILVENGAIVEFCAEPGRYTYDESSAPSFIPAGDGSFKDNLIANVKKLGKEVADQWMAGGQRFSSQRVFFINMCELITVPVKWGCGDIGFHHTGAMGEQLDITIKGNGQLTVKVSDPLMFYQNIGAQFAGTDGDVVVKIDDEGIMSNLKSGILDKIGEAISALGTQQPVAYTAIGSHSSAVKDLINNNLSQEWAGERGFEVCTFTVNGAFMPTDEDKEALKEMQRAFNMGANTNAANYDVQKTMAEGVKAAGENGGEGGMMGIGLGMGAIGNAGLGQMTNQNPQPAAPAAAAPVAGGWTCACGTTNTGNFCTNCGSAKPAAPAGGFCPECGTKLPDGAKFCTNCGKQL